MKTVCLLGSPRPKGNSTTIARRFCDTAKKSGSDVEIFALNKLSYRGCQACMACKTELDKCILKDELSEVLDAVQKTDILVMATPVYFGDVSSLLKAFIDRTFSYLKPDYIDNQEPGRLSSGKKLVFIQTQGGADEGRFKDVFPRYNFFFKWFGFNDNHLIRACGINDEAEIEKRQDILKYTEDLAVELIDKI